MEENKMIKKYHGNFPSLVKNGKIFSKFLVRGRESVQVTDSTFHIIGSESLLTFSQKAKVLTHREYTIVRDNGRYHIFT